MSEFRIFTHTSLPIHHRKNKLASSAHWLTWSIEFKSLIVELEKQGMLNRRVLLKSIEGCSPYDATYHVSLNHVPSKLQVNLCRAADSLYKWSMQKKLLMFRDMLTRPINSDVLKVVFAYLRAALVVMMKDERAALYAPVNRASKDLGFKLHADLFLTTQLWLIYDDVPTDGSGATLLLPRQALLTTLTETCRVPSRLIHKISTLMTGPIAQDSFNELYELLHDETKRWHNPLAVSLQTCADSITFRAGEGYLLDDREWLHGRTPSSTPVTSKRFHRLTFRLRGC